ncbi:MAG: hypothetical protein J5693_01570 [Bacteroidales bacterium]|nr:hypothetical protein [Bacteroidales bacterium]
MKKFFVILATVALVASAACTKVEKPATDEKISFNVANYTPATKANVSLVGETTTFKSKAYLHAVGVTDVQNFFGENGETITANNTTNPSAWEPSHDYYWPKSKQSYINFVSWYDKNGTITEATETTLKWTNRTIATDDNIMWADEAWRFNKNNNPATYHMNAVTEGVPTLFHHALAKLCIKAKATKVQGGTREENKTAWVITLEDINISNTYNAGTLTLTNSDPSTGTTIAATTKAYTAAGTEKIGWTTSGTAAGISMDDTSELTTDLVNVLDEQSVLPQTLSDDAKLTFTLHIITKYNGTQYSEEKIPVEVALNTLKGTATGATAITAWEMNTKYTYNIIVDPETTVVKFDPAVVDWEVVSDAPTYTIPTGQID